MDKKIVPAAASNSELARYIRELIESRQESIDDLEDCLISLQSMDERNENSIDLRVGKAIPSDVGFGRVRIPLNNSLGVKPGDIVSIEGSTGPLPSRGSTAAIVWRARPDDSGLSVARMDGIIRENAKLRLGEIATLRKLDPEQCSELTLYPDFEGEGLRELRGYFRKYKSGKGIEGYARRGLNGRPVKAGDTVLIPGVTSFANHMPFRVKETSPRGVVIVRPETRIKIIIPEIEEVGPGPEGHPQNLQNCCSNPDAMKGDCLLRGLPAARSCTGAIPESEILDLLLGGTSSQHRQLILILAILFSKSEDSGSNSKEKRMH